jgi:hypothetical protein
MTQEQFDVRPECAQELFVISANGGSVTLQPGWVA